MRFGFILLAGLTAITGCQSRKSNSTAEVKFENQSTVAVETVIDGDFTIFVDKTKQAHKVDFEISYDGQDASKASEVRFKKTNITPSAGTAVTVDENAYVVPIAENFRCGNCFAFRSFTVVKDKPYTDIFLWFEGDKIILKELFGRIERSGQNPPIGLRITNKSTRPLKTNGATVTDLIQTITSLKSVSPITMVPVPPRADVKKVEGFWPVMSSKAIWILEKEQGDMFLLIDTSISLGVNQVIGPGFSKVDGRIAIIKDLNNPDEIVKTLSQEEIKAALSALIKKYDIPDRYKGDEPMLPKFISVIAAIYANGDSNKLEAISKSN